MIAAIPKGGNEFIWLDSTNAWLDLGFRTLTVHAKEHSLAPGSVTNYGAIIWIPDPRGTLVIVR